MSTTQLVNNLVVYIVNPVLALIFAAGLLVFFWGTIEFLLGLNGLAEASKKADGKRHMFWGLVGMFIMVAAWALLGFIADNVCGGFGSCFPTS